MNDQPPAQEAASTPRRKSPRECSAAGTRGRVGNIEAQESSSVIREAQDAASADSEAPGSLTMIREAQEAASADIEAQESTSLTRDAHEAAAADIEASPHQ